MPFTGSVSDAAERAKDLHGESWPGQRGISLDLPVNPGPPVWP
jgi:hypothetical protein